MVTTGSPSPVRAAYPLHWPTALVGLSPTATTPATAIHAAAIHRARFFFGLASSLSVMPDMMTIREAH